MLCSSPLIAFLLSTVWCLYHYPCVKDSAQRTTACKCSPVAFFSRLWPLSFRYALLICSSRSPAYSDSSQLQRLTSWAQLFCFLFRVFWRRRGLEWGRFACHGRVDSFASAYSFLLSFFAKLNFEKCYASVIGFLCSLVRFWFLLLLFRLRLGVAWIEMILRWLEDSTRLLHYRFEHHGFWWRFLLLL